MGFWGLGPCFCTETTDGEVFTSVRKLSLGFKGVKLFLQAGLLVWGGQSVYS